MAVTPFARRSCTALVVIVATGPWSAAQVDPGTSSVELTCKGTAQTTLKPGVDTTKKDFDITIEDSVLEFDDVTDGLFAGCDIAAELPATALDAFAEAGASPGGLKHVAWGHSISLSR